MRIALFCNDDLTTNIIFAPVFDVPGVEVAGVFFVRNVNRKQRNPLLGVLSMIKKMDARYWFYLVATNGVFKLFELLTRILHLSPRSGDCVSLRRLAEARNIPCEAIENFGGPAFIGRIKNMQLDMLLIRVGAILKPEMLAAPKVATWCVHSSLMPAFKGIAGEFHALRTPDAPIGSTVFLVTPKLDEGPPLAQVTITRDEKRSVFDHMIRNNKAASTLLANMLGHQVRGETLNYELPGKDLPASYFSWPQNTHIQEAQQHGIRLIRVGEWLKLLAQAVRVGKL